MSSLVEKYENQHLHRCQSRVADEGCRITEKEMGEMTFILRYDFIKVGISSFSYAFKNLECFYFRMSIEHRFHQTRLY